MIPVSVIVVTRNEAQRIEACLKALSGFDDIVVVDSGSDDGTAEIARHLGARVVDFQWNGKYPKKRQWCLDNVATRHAWIFFVDADERVTPEVTAEIAALDFSCAGYFVAGRTIWNGQRLRYGMKNNKLVLLRRDFFEFPAVDDLDLPMGEVEGHYQPVLKAECAGMRLGSLRAALDHDAATTREAWTERHRRYAAWEHGMNVRRAWPRDPVWVRQAMKTAFRALPCRGLVMFLYGYVWKRGFLDGAAGFDYARARGEYYREIERFK
jgi:glycosyltransferase involved in cell wall biosynthesis